MGRHVCYVCVVRMKSLMRHTIWPLRWLRTCCEPALNCGHTNAASGANGVLRHTIWPLLESLWPPLESQHRQTIRCTSCWIQEWPNPSPHLGLQVWPNQAPSEAVRHCGPRSVVRKARTSGLVVQFSTPCRFKEASSVPRRSEIQYFVGLGGPPSRARSPVRP
jgi:hypothetical protein